MRKEKYTNFSIFFYNRSSLWIERKKLRYFLNFKKFFKIIFLTRNKKYVSSKFSFVILNFYNDAIKSKFFFLFYQVMQFFLEKLLFSSVWKFNFQINNRKKFYYDYNFYNRSMKFIHYVNECKVFSKQNWS